ncbi:hypothetical protein SUGI_0466540 [Cryptomeria japonica]|nr:hypothetical protein SUGI_0466540 [Cryptomeria japonica]
MAIEETQFDGHQYDAKMNRYCKLRGIYAYEFEKPSTIQQRERQTTKDVMSPWCGENRIVARIKAKGFFELAVDRDVLVNKHLDQLKEV